jgi:hypothetical protein
LGKIVQQPIIIIIKIIIKTFSVARCQRLTPVILATWEAKLRRIKIQGQPRQVVLETPSPK